MNDKVVLISGGGSGFGKAMALKFASEGSKVLISGRRPEKLEMTAAETKKACPGATIEYIRADMGRLEEAQAMVDRAVELWGGVDVLINNAGGGVRIAPFDTYTQQEIQTIIEINLMTAIQGCQAVIPLMKRQRSGVIINVASACAKHAWPSWSVYTAAKMGLLGLSRCLYAELRPHGVRVGTLVPGASETEFSQAAGALYGLDGDSLTAEDVAASAYLMASLPQRAAIEELVVWGTNQEVIPL
ncbi:SDR family oxidoreductase [Paenibacillus thalictri]|uniref:SDR family oxidoreductase n=1 Tax=Paenibacillus thalictri TaxID=2527873 RepID=A0A4Q9DP53_9BACL|nr:SDR family oxidoreductase [Paenibacillus thalictri]TBL76363.1 SDR family oxidoreductase [Paenibacillus thalictri]